jgi:hypothetical protein
MPRPRLLQQLLASAAMAMTLSLAACATAQSASPPPPPPTTEPTPTATPTAQSASLRPEPQVPVSCDAFDGPAVVADLVNVEVELRSGSSSPFWAAELEQAALLLCTYWQVSETSQPARFDVTVARFAETREGQRSRPVTDWHPIPGYDGEIYCHDRIGLGCYVGATVGDFIVTSFFTAGANAAPDQSTARERILAELIPVLDAIATSTPAEPWSPAPDAWPVPGECTILEPAVPGVVAALGLESAEIADVSRFSEDSEVSAEEAAIGGSTTCHFEQAGADGGMWVRAFLLSSGAWLFDDLTEEASSEEIEIPGADRAVRTDDGDLIAAIGPNAVSIASGPISSTPTPTPEQELEAFRAIVAALAGR